MRFHVLTLFPEMITQVMGESIIGRAIDSGLISLNAVNIRDYSNDKHNKVDDYPYGGGAGMLMQADPVYDAWSAVTGSVPRRIRTIYVTPQGRTFTQDLAKELARESELIFLCGHYEGIDERVLCETVTDYVSIGDYVLTGGELPAMVMIDAIARMVPGVLSNDMSGADESFEGNLLEYPQYSRPEVWHGTKVPDVLLSGNAAAIKKYRLKASVERTKERRPDLYESYMRMERIKERLMAEKLLHIDMIELINRGHARLIYDDGHEICLKDEVSGIYFHSVPDGSIPHAIEAIRRDAMSPVHADGRDYVVLHQAEAVPYFEAQLGAQTVLECVQSVYTRREKVPVKGLYVTDGTYRAGKDDHRLLIRRLEDTYAETVYKNYKLAKSFGYIKERMSRGLIFGAFADGELAGFVGLHDDGGMGMLEVLPQFRRRGIGRALEVFMINRCLEWGFTPYGNIDIQNAPSIKLQEAIGLYFSKKDVYWMAFEKSGCV